MTTYEPADWRPEPGERAVIMTPVGGERQAMRLGLGGWVDTDNLMWSGPGVTHARKLEVVDPASVVTLDPDNPDDVQRIADNRSWTTWQAEQWIRDLLPAVTPPEPNGLGAVVVDVDDQWVRTSGDKGAVAPWLSATEGEEERDWGHMNGPDVVSHGVGCSCGAPDCNGGSDA